jgi:4-hydroxy-3-methylbut-2-enyl diphosphate reductase IspH
MQSNSVVDPPEQPNPIRIIRAEHLGMCFGVRAIALAHDRRRPAPHHPGDLVHNATVSADLRARGLRSRTTSLM